MAVTQNTYTGDGTTVLFSFTFPYLETTDIKVSVNGTNTTAYTLANATTIQFNTAPANAAAIRIYRETDDSALAAAFYPGSAIRSADLNDNFTQNLYVTQESNNNATTAITTANTALTNSTTAISTANSALSQSTTALSNSSTALNQSNTAISNSATALSQSNTAISDSASAVSTSATAASNASTALSQSTTALSNSSTALSQSNTALSNSSSAVSSATTAVNTANNALSAANAAQSTANTADANANAALNAIAGTVQYVLVANVAAIPSTPGNGDAIEIADSTGIESFTPITNLPAGFVGDSGLSVRLQYLSAGSSWNWLNYFANNSETRYLKFGGGTITGNLEIGNSGSLTFEGSTANAFETTLAVADPTADRTITLPDVSGTVVTTGDTGSVTSTMIADGTIVDADVNASAAIAGTKISPDFGAQNVTTTGTSTAASFIPTSSTAPTNGVYLPAANSVAISTNSSGRLFIDSSGRVGVGTNNPQSLLHLETDGTALRIVRGSSTGFIYNTGTSLTSPTRLQSNDGSVDIYTRVAQPITFTTNDGERMRLDASGRLGIGTSSVSANLDLVGSTSTSANNTITDAAFRVRSNLSGTENFAIRHRGASAGISGLNNTCQLIGSGTNAIELYTVDATPVVFGTSATERMRLDSSGRLGIGTTSAAGQLSCTSDFVFGNQSSTGTGGTGRIIATGGEVYIQGGLAATSGSAAPIVFTSYGGVGERARFDASGRLLVGTSTARENFYNTSGVTVQLQVEGAGNSTRSAIVTNSNDTSGSQILLAKSRSSSVGGNSIVSSGDALGLISFQGADGTEFVEAARIFAEVDGTSGANDMPGRLVFSTTADGASSPTERMRIASNGFVGVNINSALAGEKFRVANSGAGANTAIFTFDSSDDRAIIGTLHSGSSGATSRKHFDFLDGGGFSRGSISVNGSATAFNTSSDYRLKENVVPVSDGIARLQQLKPSRFNFIGDDNPTVDGFIAHEVQPVVPEAVTGEKDAVDDEGKPVYQGIDQSKLVPLLTAALQEAIGRIETLEAEVAALKAQ